MSEEYFLHKDLRNIQSGDGSKRLYVITNCHKDRTQAVVELTILKRYNIKQLGKAKELFDKIENRSFDIEKILSG